MTTKTKTENGLCPGCEEPVVRNSNNRDIPLFDMSERPWHQTCVQEKLALHFRTPLADIEANAAVEFECVQNSFTAPHAFHLREIVFEEDVEIEGIYIGNKIVAYAMCETLRVKDFPGRKIVIDHDMPLGIPITFTCRARDGQNILTKDVKYRLIGDRRREHKVVRPSRQQILAVFPLRTETEVSTGEYADAVIPFIPTLFKGDRIVCDDWDGWEVIDVRAGKDPGWSSKQTLFLHGVSTDCPIYISHVCEQVHFTMKNNAEKPRKLVARVYGLMAWEG